MISRRKLFAWLTGAAIAPVLPLPVQAQWTRRSGMLKVTADPCLLDIVDFDALMGDGVFDVPKRWLPSDRQIEIFRAVARAKRQSSRA